jgi:hypothetical protein
MPSILTKRYSYKIIFIYSPGFVRESFKGLNDRLCIIKVSGNKSPLPGLFFNNPPYKRITFFAFDTFPAEFFDRHFQREYPLITSFVFSSMTRRKGNIRDIRRQGDSIKCDGI